VNYFNDKNVKIDSGELKDSQKVVVSALMIKLVLFHLGDSYLFTHRIFAVVSTTL